jgi:hypothetical protein
MLHRMAAATTAVEDHAFAGANLDTQSNNIRRG